MKSHRVLARIPETPNTHTGRLAPGCKGVSRPRLLSSHGRRPRARAGIWCLTRRVAHRSRVAQRHRVTPKRGECFWKQEKDGTVATQTCVGEKQQTRMPGVFPLSHAVGYSERGREVVVSFCGRRRTWISGRGWRCGMLFRRDDGRLTPSGTWCEVGDVRSWGACRSPMCVSVPGCAHVHSRWVIWQDAGLLLSAERRVLAGRLAPETIRGRCWRNSQLLSGYITLGSNSARPPPKDLDRPCLLPAAGRP